MKVTKPLVAPAVRVTSRLASASSTEPAGWPDRPGKVNLSALHQEMCGRRCKYWFGREVLWRTVEKKAFRPREWQQVAARDEGETE